MQEYIPTALAAACQPVALLGLVCTVVMAWAEAPRNVTLVSGLLTAVAGLGVAFLT